MAIYIDYSLEDNADQWSVSRIPEIFICQVTKKKEIEWHRSSQGCLYDQPPSPVYKSFNLDWKRFKTLRWRHNGRDSISNHQFRDCLLNRLFRRRSSKDQRSASLAFVWGIHWGPVNCPYKWPVTRKMFPFDDVIMKPGFSLAGIIHSQLIFC